MSDSESEADFFLEQTQVPNEVSFPIGGYKLSVVEYFFLVIFNWDLMVGAPFEMLVREAFTVNDFPEEWIDGHLSEVNRKEKRQLSMFGEGKYSLFCKVQKGTKLFDFVVNFNAVLIFFFFF